MTRALLSRLLMLAAIAGCSDATLAPDGNDSEFSQGVVARQKSASVATTQKLARAFAIALASQPVRSGVRDAMRASRVTEHKLLLQEFAGTPAGKKLVALAARAVSEEPASLEAAIHSLPPMDFYVPSRDHRLRWTAGADVLVAATISDVAPVRGYSTEGASVALQLNRRQPREALVMLQPAEGKSPRLHPQMRREGSTIQDADDGDLSGALVMVDRNGNTSLTSVADAMMPAICGGPDCPPPPPPPPPPSDTTLLQNFSVGDICDNGNCGEGNEFEFRAKYFINGSLAGSGTVRFEGIRRFTSNFVNAKLIFKRIRENSSETITVQVIETDGFPNPDDNFGTRTLTYSSNGQIVRYVVDLGQTAINAVFRWTKKF